MTQTAHTNPGNREGSQLIESAAGLIHAVCEGPTENQNAGNSAPAILFIHGNYFGLPIWDPWVHHLRKSYRCIRLDLPGFGLSHPPRAGRYSDGVDQSALTAVLDAYQIDKAHLVGTVLGGKVAYQFAAFQHHRVKSLTLMNSAGLLRHLPEGCSPDTPIPLPDQVKDMLLSAPESFLEEIIRGFTGPKGTIPFALAREMVKISSRPLSMRELVKRLEQYTLGQAQMTLAKITCPVLLMHGGDNPQYAADDIDIFEKALTQAPTVQKHVYSGYGQLLPAEGCYQALRDFETFIQEIDA